MFSKIGAGELIVILVIALFVIGPDRLPSVAKSLGKVLGSASKYIKDITEEIKGEVKDVEKDLKLLEADLKDAESTLKGSLEDTDEKSPPDATEAETADDETTAGSTKAEGESWGIDLISSAVNMKEVQAESADL